MLPHLAHISGMDLLDKVYRCMLPIFYMQLFLVCIFQAQNNVLVLGQLRLQPLTRPNPEHNCQAAAEINRLIAYRDAVPANPADSRNIPAVWSAGASASSR